MIDLAEGERLLAERNAVKAPAIPIDRIKRLESWLLLNADALLSTARDAVALREKVERLEGALDRAWNVLDAAPELNMANYHEEQVAWLNGAVIEAHSILNEARTALHRLEDKEA